MRQSTSRSPKSVGVNRCGAQLALERLQPLKTLPVLGRAQTPLPRHTSTNPAPAPHQHRHLTQVPDDSSGEEEEGEGEANGERRGSGRATAKAARISNEAKEVRADSGKQVPSFHALAWIALLQCVASRSFFVAYLC